LEKQKLEKRQNLLWNNEVANLLAKAQARLMNDPKPPQKSLFSEMGKMSSIE
tara:strand:+ start:171 stop:326 length:156 start_codon:yes stop_codon:yes gene_type:complete